jgi:hypothetical protein
MLTLKKEMHVDMKKLHLVCWNVSHMWAIIDFLFYNFPNTSIWIFFQNFLNCHLIIFFLHVNMFRVKMFMLHVMTWNLSYMLTKSILAYTVTGAETHHAPHQKVFGTCCKFYGQTPGHLSKLTIQIRQNLTIVREQSR